MKLKQRELLLTDVSCKSCNDVDETEITKQVKGFPMSNTVSNLIRESSLAPVAQTTCLGYLTGFLELATDTPRLFSRMTLEQLKERYVSKHIHIYFMRETKMYFRAILELALENMFGDISK